jgi:hypothetical protein
MSLTFGYDLKDGDKILEAPNQLNSILRELAPAGIALVYLFPFCAVPISSLLATSISEPLSVLHIPSWVPFLSYEPLAQIGRRMSERIRNEPIDFVKNALVGGDRAPSTHID